jgi:peptidylprolyl isomerase
VVFHRVIPGFMAQGGDPTGTGEGGSKLPDLKAEFNSLPHFRGTVAAARAESPDSANSQFYIMFAPNSSLDGNYTVFGRVISGMEAVDAIAPGDPPANPTKIVHASLGDGTPAPAPAPAPQAQPEAVQQENTPGG